MALKIQSAQISMTFLLDLITIWSWIKQKRNYRRLLKSFSRTLILIVRTLLEHKAKSPLAIKSDDTSHLWFSEVWVSQDSQIFKISCPGFFFFYFDLGSNCTYAYNVINEYTWNTRYNVQKYLEMWHIKPHLEYFSHSHKGSRQIIFFKAVLAIKFTKIFSGDKTYCHIFH